ncbi:thiolase family protein [Verticiella sediminum]|uniref:propanoyl-CoA C-acyltransferase n=1 Tax=Verticiella sediminum TaxID=1247510 RepID=A0A556AWK6_9BURK|nr:thiolase family protein [Verticiella sediminum]TSH97333.1 thiolase family protein [Verticiella sediminum]
MTTQTAVVGTGIVPFGKFLDRSIRNLAEEAVKSALDDAGIDAGLIDQVYFGNSAAGLITGQEMIRGQAALRNTGLLGKPIINVENACASSSTAFFLGCQAIAAGQADFVLVVGAEKLTHVERRVSLEVFGSAVDLEETQPPSIGSGSGSIFMDIYAEKTRQYMAATGATREDFAQIVVKSRRAGALNDKAQFRKPTTIEEVLSSRLISDPLTLPMCSAIGDGAAAIVLCSRNALKKLTAPRPIWVAGTTMASGLGASAPVSGAVRVSRAVYEMSGIGAEDLHVVELHDASAPAELIHYENLGLCAPGEGPALLRSGATDIDGRISVNPSGGLLSRGHPIGATGAAQIVEVVMQLRGDAGQRQRHGAKVGMAENNGGQIDGDAAATAASIFCK